MNKIKKEFIAFLKQNNAYVQYRANLLRYKRKFLACPPSFFIFPPNFYDSEKTFYKNLVINSFDLEKTKEGVNFWARINNMWMFFLFSKYNL